MIIGSQLENAQLENRGVGSGNPATPATDVKGKIMHDQDADALCIYDLNSQKRLIPLDIVSDYQGVDAANLLAANNHTDTEITTVNNRIDGIVTPHIVTGNTAGGSGAVITKTINFALDSGWHMFTLHCQDLLSSASGSNPQSYPAVQSVSSDISCQMSGPFMGAFNFGRNRGWNSSRVNLGSCPAVSLLVDSGHTSFTFIFTHTHSISGYSNQEKSMSLGGLSYSFHKVSEL